MAKITIENRVVRCCGSINFNDIHDEMALKLMLNKLYDIFYSYNKCDSFYLIAHTDTETYHIHYLLILKQQCRLKTILNYIGDNLGIDTRAINIDKLYHISSHLRYFLHIDSESKKLGKKEYQVLDIRTNDNMEILQSYLNSNDDEITSDYLCSLVIKYNYEFELMNRLGLKLYHKYRYEIKMLYDNRGQLIYKSNEKDDDLPF